MQISVTHLTKTYAEMDDESLIQTYLGGGITEDAFKCLMSEMSSRGIDGYQLYVMADISNLENRKKEIVREIDSLRKTRKDLLDNVQKTKEKNHPKKKSIFRLIFERKRLEEESKIKKLKGDKNP